MRNIIVVFLIAFMVFAFGSCKETIITWEDNSEPGRRDYVWTADTINTYMDFVQRIDGIDTNNILAVGPSGNGQYIRKYSNKKWNLITEPIIKEDVITILYSGTNDIWLAGGEGNIWHYDGNWRGVVKYTDNKFGHILFTDFCKTPYNQIIISGAGFFPGIKQRGLLLINNNNKWKKIYEANENSQYIRIDTDDKYPEAVFIYSIKWSNAMPGQTDTMQYLKYEGNKMEVICSKNIFPTSSEILRKMGHRLYFGMYDGIYRYENGGFVPYLKLDENQTDLYSFFGRHDKDIFITDKYGLYHFNGTNKELIKTFTGYSMFVDAVLFEKDIFMITTPDYRIFIIHHGKLK